MTLDDALHHLGVDPAVLEPAPADPARAEISARIGLDPKPCSACGQPTRTTGVVYDDAGGPRWFDRCRDCFLATPPATPMSIGEIVQGACEIAAEMGVPLTVITDDRGE